MNLVPRIESCLMKYVGSIGVVKTGVFLVAVGNLYRKAHYYLECVV